jgi:hypothetical protein
VENPLGKDFDPELQAGQSWVEGGVGAWVASSAAMGDAQEDEFADEYDGEEHLAGDSRWMAPEGLPRATRWSSARGGGGGGRLQPSSLGGGGGGGNTRNFEILDSAGAGIRLGRGGGGGRRMSGHDGGMAKHHHQQEQCQPQRLAPDPTPGGGDYDDFVTPADRPRLRTFNGDTRGGRGGGGGRGGTGGAVVVPMTTATTAADQRWLSKRTLF